MSPLPTRDSKLWWFVMAGSIVTAISTRLDLLDALLPENYHKQAHALIEIVALLMTAASGIATMSPLSISDEGRRKAIRRDTGHLPKASIAAAVANVAAAEAVEATEEAAKKAAVAKDLAKG